MVLHERLNAVEPFLLAARHIEVHVTLLTFVSRKSLAALSPRRLSAARPFIVRIGTATTTGTASAERSTFQRIDISAFKP
jgi:hypothetical protein